MGRGPEEWRSEVIPIERIQEGGQEAQKECWRLHELSIAPMLCMHCREAPVQERLKALKTWLKLTGLYIIMAAVHKASSELVAVHAILKDEDEEERSKFPSVFN